MLTTEQLEELKALESNQIDRSQLVDIRDVQIDMSLPIGERIKSYLEQIKNPYHFLYGNCAVHVRFEENGKPLSDKLKSYFTSLKKE